MNFFSHGNKVLSPVAVVKCGFPLLFNKNPDFFSGPARSHALSSYFSLCPLVIHQWKVIHLPRSSDGPSLSSHVSTSVLLVASAYNTRPYPRMAGFLLLRSHVAVPSWERPSLTTLSNMPPPHIF